MGQKQPGGFMVISDLMKIVPEMAEIYLIRVDILKTISGNQPIGRRGIVRLLDLNERQVRNQCEILQKFNYIKTSEMGMYITEEGLEVLKLSEAYVQEFKNLALLRNALIKYLGISDVHIVDATVGGAFNSNVFASAAQEHIHEFLENDQVIGITGGSTMKQLVDGMKTDREYPDSIIVPARGSLGRKYKYQANSIVEILADKLGADYFTINFPDYIDSELIQGIEHDQEIKKYNTLVGEIDLLIFGVGRADIMSQRRGLSTGNLELLERKNAVSEAFGNYFDIDGNIIYETGSIGLSLEGYKKVKTAVAVASGQEKAEAIVSLCKVRKDIVVIMDLECANAVLDSKK